MKRKILISAAVLLIAALGAWKWPKQRGGEGQARRQFEAVREAIEKSVEATGSVVPLNRVEVKPPIAGRVEKLLAEEGDKVKAGQIIAWMSSQDRAAILDAARAQGPEELAKWEASYKATPIVSPLSGTVILRNVVVGETVSAATVLFAMADQLIVLAQVDESEIGKVDAGMPVRIVLDAYPDQGFTGKVSDILHEGKNVSNVITYGVKVKPDAVPSFVRSQMTASVSFIVGRNEDAVVLPSAAVLETAAGLKQVMVPGEDGKPVAREVVTGIETADKVEIVAGLAAGDKVFYGRGRYVPQAGPASSPLAMGGNRNRTQQRGQNARPGAAGAQRRRSN